MSPEPLRWLVMAYFTGVDGMAGSLHVDRIVQELESRGHEVLTVTGLVSARRGHRIRRVPSLSPAGIRFELRHLFRNTRNPLSKYLVKPLAMLCLSPFYALEKAMVNLEPTWSWSVTAKAAALSSARRFRPQVLFSSCGPYSAHFAAAAVARRTGIPWIAEFRDPVRFEGAARGRVEDRLFDRLERTVAEEASAVIYLTEAARSAAAERFVFKGRTAALNAGAPPNTGPRVSWRKGERLCLVHLGTLARTRTFAPLIRPMEALRLVSPQVYRDVLILQYGHSDGNVRAQAEALGQSAEVRGRIPNREVDDLMRSADVLLLIQDELDISTQSIPGKTYEYLHSGRPILGLVHRNPELKEMLRSLGHWAVELTDAEGIAAAIRQIHARWTAGDLVVTAQSPYTVSAFVDGLLGLLPKGAAGESG